MSEKRDSFSKQLSLIRAKTERIKGWGAIIAIIVTNAVTLVTAVSAHLKTEKETTAKAAYKELSTAIKNISANQVELQKDIASIHGYLAGIARREYRMKEEDKRNLPERIADSANNSRHLYRGTSGKKPRSFIAKPDLPNQPPKMHAKPKKYNPPNLETIQKKE